MEKVFVDTDIIIDLLSGREPHYLHAAQLFSQAEEDKIRLYVSALSFSNVHYILTRQFSNDIARKKLLQFKTLVNVLPVNDKTIELALASDFKDFEDAIQYHSALSGGIQLLVTRNLKDFKKAEINVMTAEQFLNTIN